MWIHVILIFEAFPVKAEENAFSNASGKNIMKVKKLGNRKVVFISRSDLEAKVILKESDKL